MAIWVGRYRFNNVFHHAHGASGTVTVEASDEESARSKMKEKSSREVHDTTFFTRYMTITDVKEKNYR